MFDMQGVRVKFKNDFLKLFLIYKRYRQRLMGDRKCDFKNVFQIKKSQTFCF